jgi:predicted MFS family arabinose efflux permease
MLLLIIEILLTIAVWRKGWKGWALLPAGISLALGFVLGFSIGASGGRPEEWIGLGLIIDGISIMALIIMVTRNPKKVKEDRPAELPAGSVLAKG